MTKDTIISGYRVPKGVRNDFSLVQNTTRYFYINYNINNIFILIFILIYDLLNDNQSRRVLFTEQSSTIILFARSGPSGLSTLRDK